jgi:hypothetical protein
MAVEAVRPLAICRFYPVFSPSHFPGRPTTTARTFQIYLMLDGHIQDGLANPCRYDGTISLTTHCVKHRKTNTGGQIKMK